jgi:hypothetical protein|eukprot:COSAG03_NODE_185_length_10940_cov_3.045383_2_plen_233_part_00
MAQLEDLENGNYHFSFKLAVIGDVGVGKSTLLTHHVQDDEIVDMSAEVERGYCADFLIKSYEKDGRKHVVQWWDIPGVERGDMGMVTRLCAGAAGGILMFDRDSPSSFEALGAWLAAAKQGAVGGRPPQAHGAWALVANVIGIEAGESDGVSADVARDFARQNGMEYFEMTGPSMEPFHQACFDVLSKVVSNIPDPPEPSLMLRQGIAVGGLLAADGRVREALYKPPPQDGL